MKNAIWIITFFIGLAVLPTHSLAGNTLVTCSLAKGGNFYLTKQNPQVRTSYKDYGQDTFTIVASGSYDPSSRSARITLSSIHFVNNRWTTHQQTTGVVRFGGEVNLWVWTNPGSGDFRQHNLRCFDSGL